MDFVILKQIIFFALLTVILPLYIIITIKNKTEQKGLSEVFPDLILLSGVLWMAFEAGLILIERLK